MSTQHTPEKRYPYVTHGYAASVLACELRGESHESLACHAANLTVQRDGLLAALKQLRAEVEEMTTRVGWAGNGGREMADAAIAKAEGQS